MGCADAHREKLIGPYILIAVDVDEQMCVAYYEGKGISITRVLPVVFAVGFDANYIVAKRHPDNNRSITQFYYIDIAKDGKHSDQFKAVTGPLTEDEFKKAKAELGLPEFKTTFPHLL
ncbi:MAG: hypothetical protein JNL39_00205 [Opitutaceae bacterium]|nr:hypothetical protein [Opitutaceae bacterium]